jgi:hypothetical protein
MSTNIERIEQSIQNLEKRKNKIMFFVPDLNGTPAGSIYEIYFHATVLKNNGHDVYILTETSKYEIPEFIESELTNVEHVSMESNKLTVSSEDLLVIPEIFTNVMEQTKSLPCMRVVLFQSIDNATKALLPGYDWTMFGIHHVITTSKTMEKFVTEFFGQGKFKIMSYNVSVPDYFVNNDDTKRPVVSILVRNERELDKIVKLFLSKYPEFRWLNFEPLLTNSKPAKQLRRKDFADRLSKNFAALWLDRISTHAQFPLECMKVGTIPISLIPDVTPEYLLDETGKNPIQKDCGVWTDDFFQIPALIADTLRKFLDDEITSKTFSDFKEITDQYTPAIATEQLTSIYGEMFIERLNSFKAAKNALEEQEKETPVTSEVQQ